MRKLMVIAWMSLLISSVAVASEKTNSLILLTAESEAETEVKPFNLKLPGNE